MKIQEIDGRLREIKTPYTVGEPYYRCMQCGKTRTLSEREKDELHEAQGWK